MKLKDALGVYRKRKLAHQRRGEGAYRSLRLLLAPAAEAEINSLSPGRVVGLLSEMAVTAPVHAIRVDGYVRPFFDWAVAEGLIAASPLAHIARPPAPPARDRLLSLEEVQAIWAACGDLGHPFAPAIGLLMLTLALREEVGAMRLSEIARNGASPWIWRLRGRSTAEGTFPIPLSSRAVDLINAALPRRQRGADLILSTTGKTAISGWSRAKRRLDALIGEGRGPTVSEPWRLNDLRASFLAIMTAQPANDALILERCLGRVTGFAGAMAREWMHAEAMVEEHHRVLERWADLVTGKSAATV